MMPLFRRVLAFIVSITIVFSSVTSAYANASIGGWTMLDHVINGANSTITATKQAGAGALKSVASVTPTAAKVGKNLIKGGGSVALAFAMVELADNALDWVLDPANNAVKYKPKAGAGAGDVGAGAGTGALMFCKWYDECSAGVYNYGSATAAGNATCAGYKETFVGIIEKPPYSNGQYLTVECKTTSGSRDLWNTVVKTNPAYDPSAGTGGVDSDGYKSIPIDTVAAKVIANAEAGHAPSQEAVKAVALEGFAAGELDAALDAAAEPTTADPDAPTDPTKPIDPAKPFDPSSIIDAIKALGAKLAALLTSVTTLFDWLKTEPETKPDKENEVEIVELPPSTQTVDINFGGSCPADLVLPIKFVGVSIPFTFSYSAICSAMGVIKPVVVMTAMMSYVFIVSGNRENS